MALVCTWLFGNRVVSVPFGGFSDPLLTTESDLVPLLDKARQFAESRRASVVELRPRRCVAPVMQYGVEQAGLFKHHYLRLDQPADTIFRSFSRSCVRQHIRRAETEDVAVSGDCTPETLSALCALLAATRQRHALPPIPPRFFQALARQVPSDHLRVLIARHRGEALAAGLLLKFSRCCILEYAGDAGEQREVGAAQLLYWRAIREAQAGGYELFSFGRTAMDNPGLLAYKRRWGTVEEDLPVLMLMRRGLRVRASYTLRRRLHRVASGLFRSLPELLSRRLAEFCFRHWG